MPAYYKPTKPPARNLQQDVEDVLMGAAGFLPEPVQQAAFTAEPYALSAADALFGATETAPGDIPGVPGGVPVSQGAMWGGAPMTRYLYTQFLKKARTFPGLKAALRKRTGRHVLSEELSPEAKATVKRMQERTGKENLEALGEFQNPRGLVAGRTTIRPGASQVDTAAHEGAHRAFDGLTPMQRQAVRNAPVHPRAQGYKGPNQANESFAYGLEEILTGKPFTGSPQLKQSIEDILLGVMGVGS